MLGRKIFRPNGQLEEALVRLEEAEEERAEAECALRQVLWALVAPNGGEGV